MRRSAWRNRWPVLLGLLLVAGCDLLPVDEVPSFLDAERSDLPPCVDDDCNCGDFRDQALAQIVLEAFQGDPFALDRDGNGFACETLPLEAPTLDPAVPPSNNVHLALGNPSNAATGNPNNFLIERSQYVLSYSSDRGIANWASWRLSADWLGPAQRQDNFRQDGVLPEGVYQVTPNDYRNSGYDRGHIVPSGDRTQSDRDNAATFLMTNVLPQSPENNRGIWRELEEYSRDLVYQLDLQLIVLAGGYGKQDNLASGKVTVPSRLWKIIVVLDPGEQGDLEISGDTQIIAVDMPNRDTSPSDWQTYLTTVDRIETATGYDFLNALPPSLQATLESKLADP